MSNAIGGCGCGGGGGAGRAEAYRQQLFKKLDQNQDGKVSKDELGAALPKGTDPAKVDALFSKLDQNQDGGVDSTEMDSMLQQMRRHHHEHGTPDPARLAAAIFKKVDADGDGKINAEELKKVLPADSKGPGADDIVKALDRDGDGNITQQELESSFKQLFDEIRSRMGQDGPATAKAYDRNGTPVPPPPVAPPDGSSTGAPPTQLSVLA